MIETAKAIYRASLYRGKIEDRLAPQSDKKLLTRQKYLTAVHCHRTNPKSSLVQREILNASLTEDRAVPISLSITILPSSRLRDLSGRFD